MAASAAIPMPDSAGEELTTLRLYLMRAMYALIGIAEGINVAPALFQHEPIARGVIPSLLVAMCLLDLIGIRYPRRMLPLLLFEFVWKTLWVAFFGYQQWSSGNMPPTFAEDFPAITAGVIIMPLIIPWGYVWRHYVTAPGDRWR
ncbi:MAG: hypothetical protein ABIO29_03825 [Sphingomicrobium sp.]